MTKTDDNWLNEYELRSIESNRVIYDLEGWAETPVKTFSAGPGVPWVDGDITEEDSVVAAGIRERVWRSKGGYAGRS